MRSNTGLLLKTFVDYQLSETEVFSRYHGEKETEMYTVCALHT